MDVDFGRVIEAISLFNTDPYKISSNFDSFPKDCQDSLKLTMAEVAMLLYHFFKIKNMFDFNMTPGSCFPFILKDIVGSNLIFMKDTVMSDITVNLYG